MTSVNYILDERGTPVAEPDLLKWAAWCGNANRRVARERIGDCVVSTVFLGIDHNWAPSGPPILWETMTFRVPDDMEIECDRCSGSREQAEAMHAEMVERVRAVLALGGKEDSD